MSVFVKVLTHWWFDRPVILNLLHGQITFLTDPSTGRWVSWVLARGVIFPIFLQGEGTWSNV
jgi:hypothetical protein